MIRTIARHWTRLIRDASIRIKLLIFALIISIIPLVAVTALNYYGIAERMTTSVKQSASQVFTQNAQLLENKINTLWSISVSIASDQDVIQYNLSDHPAAYYEDYVAQNRDYLKLLSYINSFRSYPEVERTIIYAFGHHMFADENTSFFNLDKATGTQWYQRLMAQKDLMVWFPYSRSIVTQVGAPVITAMRKIRDLNNYSDLLGILRIDLPLSQLARIVDTGEVTSGTYAFILNSRDEVVYSNREGWSPGEVGLDYATLEGRYTNADMWYDVKLEKSKYILKSAPIRYTDWFMVMLIPGADLLALSYKTRDDMILVAIITSVAASILAYGISNSLTRRIRLLASHMQAVDGSVPNTSLDMGSQDELGQLQNSFNAMLMRIQFLMKEELRLGQEIKSLEIKALQAQINPHFLYNTLDLVHWRAMNKNVPEISRIVQALAKFYKLGLSKGEDKVLLANEIEHVRMFVTIQNERFQHLLAFETDVMPEVMDCKVPKLLLQPLVENSIIHGIMENSSMKGRVQIRAFIAEGVLKILVEDDGGGMSEEQRKSLLTSASNEHYGVKNIHERIKLLYGPEYGLQYESKKGKGTMVTISLPVNR